MIAVARFVSSQLFTLRPCIPTLSFHLPLFSPALTRRYRLSDEGGGGQRFSPDRAACTFLSALRRSVDVGHRSSLDANASSVPE